MAIHLRTAEKAQPINHHGCLEGHVFFWCLLVGKIKEEDAGQRTDQEDDIKPAVVEVELEFSQNLCYNRAILQWHTHPHQQHG